MKTLKLIGIVLSFTINLYSQGMNNNLDYDKEDLNIIFKELGISTFKFPVKQSSDQIMDIVLEEYENKELINRISIIDETQKSFEAIGIDALSYFKPKADSVYLHRFYFIKGDSIVKVRIKTHGIQTFKEFSLKGKSLFDINTHADVSTVLKDDDYLEFNNIPEVLVYLYANSSEEKDKPLWCSNGLSKQELLEQFHYFIFVSVQPYERE